MLIIVVECPVWFSHSSTATCKIDVASPFPHISAAITRATVRPGSIE